MASAVVFPAWSPLSPEADAIVQGYVFDRLTTFPATSPNSRAYALTPPSSDWTLTFELNDVPVGSVAILAGQNLGAFTWPLVVSAQEGDRLTFIAPAVQDGALGGLMISLVGSQ